MCSGNTNFRLSSETGTNNPFTIVSVNSFGDGSMQILFKYLTLIIQHIVSSVLHNVAFLISYPRYSLARINCYTVTSSLSERTKGLTL